MTGLLIFGRNLLLGFPALMEHSPKLGHHGFIRWTLEHIDGLLSQGQQMRQLRIDASLFVYSRSAPPA